MADFMTEFESQFEFVPFEVADRVTWLGYTEGSAHPNSEVALLPVGSTGTIIKVSEATPAAEEEEQMLNLMRLLEGPEIVDAALKDIESTKQFIWVAWDGVEREPMAVTTSEIARA